MKQKKVAVLHAQIPFARGGAELLVEMLVLELKRRNYDAELISIPFKWYPENGLYNSMIMWRMTDLQEINGEKIDLVIPTKFPTYGVKHPNKVLWLMHQHRAAYDLYNNKEHFGFGTIENGKAMQQKVQTFDAKTIGEANSIYTISQNVSDRLLKNNGISSKALYHPPALAGKYYTAEYGDYILSVGRLDPLKRVDLLIKALAHCKKTVKVKIAGKGPEMEKLQKMVRDLHLEKRVDFLGFVSDEELLKLYANAKGVFFAPVDEDYGYITLESFLSKKPIITCNDAGGVLEFTHDKQNGFVCGVNENDIAEAINALFDDETLCKRLGNNGYEIASEISWDNVIDTLTCSIKRD